MNASETDAVPTLEALRWRNCRLVPFVLLLGAFAAVAAMHFATQTWLDPIRGLPGYPSALLTDLGICRIRALDFVQTHVWMTMVFLSFSLASLLWLDLRKAPRWAVWSTLFPLSVPCVAYIWICARICTVPDCTMGPAL